jgi:type II secretory pathway component PulF
MQKLNKRETAMLSLIKRGETLCCMRSTADSEAANGSQFWLEPSQKRCGPKTAISLIKKGEVSPTSADMFGGVAQSYAARQ